MATPTLVETAGATNANTYCTLAEAETYHDSRVEHESWADANNDEKNKALLMATRLLDDLYEWAGFPTNEDQALQWPRNAVMDRHNWNSIDIDTIPERLKQAQAEFAAQLLAEDRSLDYDVERYGLNSLRAGPVSMAFKQYAKAKVVPDAVQNLIPSWWGRLRTKAALSIPVARS